MNLNEEKILIDKAKTDPYTFGILYDFYYKQIFSYVFRRVGNYEIARDITSETFLKAFIKINSFKWQGISISAWFYRIATNEINQFLRAKKYRPSYLHELFSSMPQLTDASNEDTIKERMEQEEQQDKDFIHVQQQLKLLPVKYQEVITLKYFGNKSTNEISVILSKKVGTIKSLLSRGLEKLKKLL